MINELSLRQRLLDSNGSRVDIGNSTIVSGLYQQDLTSRKYKGKDAGSFLHPRFDVSLSLDSSLIESVIPLIAKDKLLGVTTSYLHFWGSQERIRELDSTYREKCTLYPSYSVKASSEAGEVSFSYLPPSMVDAEFYFSYLFEGEGESVDLSSIVESEPSELTLFDYLGPDGEHIVAADILETDAEISYIEGLFRNLPEMLQEREFIHPEISSRHLDVFQQIILGKNASVSYGLETHIEFRDVPFSQIPFVFGTDHVELETRYSDAEHVDVAVKLKTFDPQKIQLNCRLQDLGGNHISGVLQRLGLNN